jgi:hypothetical protein
MKVAPAASNQLPTNERSGEIAVAKIMSPKPLVRFMFELIVPVLGLTEVTTG